MIESELTNYKCSHEISNFSVQRRLIDWFGDPIAGRNFPRIPLWEVTNVGSLLTQVAVRFPEKED